MNENTSPDPARGAPDGAQRDRHPSHPFRRENLTTQQMRVIGKRRTDAEEKLAHHLEQARHPARDEHAAGEPAADHQ